MATGWPNPSLSVRRAMALLPSSPWRSGFDSLKIINADTAIEGLPVRTVVIGDACVDQGAEDRPRTLVRLIGNKGRVLTTLFSAK